MPDPTISIVIVAGRDGPGLESSLDALKTQSRQAGEIIIVGGGAVQKRLRGAGPVRFIATAGDHPPTAQLVMGLESAEGDIIVVLSCGARPDGADWLERLVAPLSDPDTGAACSRVRTRLAGRSWREGLMTCLAGTVKRVGRPGRRRGVVALTGRADALRAQALKDCGFPDARAFPTIAWHLDLSARLRQADFAIVQTDASVVQETVPVEAQSCAGPWAMALEAGRAEGRLRSVHKMEGMQAALCLMSVAAFCIIPLSMVSLPLATGAMLALFVWSWFHAFGIPAVRVQVPAGLAHFALFAAAVLLTRVGGPLEPERVRWWAGVHPALLRQWFFVLSGLGLWTLALFGGAAYRSWAIMRTGVPLSRLPATFAASALAGVLSGVGFLKTTLQGLLD